MATKETLPKIYGTVNERKSAIAKGWIRNLIRVGIPTLVILSSLIACATGPTSSSAQSGEETVKTPEGVQKLYALLKITPRMDREQLTNQLVSTSFDTSWIRPGVLWNTGINVTRADGSNYLVVLNEQGEPLYPKPETTRKLNYPFADQESYDKYQFSVKSGNNTLSIHAPPAVRDGLESSKQLFAEFLASYTALIPNKAKVSIIYWRLPVGFPLGTHTYRDGQQVTLTMPPGDPNAFVYTMFNDNPARLPMGATLPDVAAHHVFIYMPSTHENIVNTGDKLPNSLIASFVNELVGAHISIKMKTKRYVPEHASSIAGIIAGVDTGFARKYLGIDPRPVVNRLEIGTRPWNPK